jgi:hypothetical protein
MTKRKEKIIRSIRKSCITGKAVWLNHNMTYMGEWIAYRRACQREIELVKKYPKLMEQRRANIMKLLSDLLASLPAIGELPPEKKAAAKALMKIADSPPPCYKDFYNHIMEERRRKEADRKIRAQMKERAKNGEL